MNMIVYKILFCFLSLLTALIVKNNHILAGIYFIFLKKVLYQTWKTFNTKVEPQWTDWERSYQVKQILALFCKLIALILGSKSVIELQKLSKKIKFERVWGKLEAKNCFQRQSFRKYLRQTLFFMLNSALQEQITLHFTSGERKIWSTIKRLQNIMNMIVGFPKLNTVVS